MTLKEEMRGVFARWKDSGLSLRAFGKREGMSYNKLQYWRRKLREGEAEEKPAFGEIHLVEEAKEIEPEVFEVCLSNGVGVGVPSGFDEVELRRLIGVLSTC